MVNKFAVFAVVLFLGFSVNSFAQEKLSCADLEASANDLDDIADGFHAAADSINENDAVDQALRNIIDSLHMIAGSEQESDLSLNVGRLEVSWQNMDSENFALALDATINSFDRLLQRDCY
jgi:hypothetical protein